MKALKGLQELYDLYKNALMRNQQYLDPQHDPKGHPQNVATFEYTLNFQKFYIRGDTTDAAMQSFCSLYEQKIAAGKKVSNLLDPEILIASGDKLRLPGAKDAEGLYFVKVK